MKTERMPVRIFEDDKAASKVVAQRIAQTIRIKASRGRSTVLGLATGHTPVNVYRELVRMHQQDGLDLSSVITFNLDEYWPVDPAAIQSYWTWMHENFFDHVNIANENIHIPSGKVHEAGIEAHCQAYEDAIAAAGGIDLQILGIGRTGHIGFNEPGSPRDSRTRCLRLDKVTRKDAASDFFGEENVPEMAITMGVGTILAAREICLLAFGEHKAPIIRRTVEEEVSTNVVASYLQQHPNATMFLDEAAAASLTRVDAPWVVDANCQWDDMLSRHAVIWLSRKLDKPVLKLTDEDYSENGLARLRAHGGAYNLNLSIFRYMMNTITGWPGGKEGPKRILVFSPHPDDDVICMGGTLMRLVEQGHDVHVAYMVSGYLSVFDHDVSRYADFALGFSKIFDLSAQAIGNLEKKIDQFLTQKNPGDMDTPEVQQLKGLIRRSEAIDAANFCGLKQENLHFLELPFYNSGRVQKLTIGPQDIAGTLDILNTVGPQMLFAAGDMSDPHGTHRLCLEAVLKALDQYKTARPDLWLYRGAWQEWSPEQIQMAVPLSPDELTRKRFGIFRHESQKDRAMFPGPYDSREFWQRAEERNRDTAAIYDALGLPEYQALEAFVRWPVTRPANTTAQFEKAQ